MPPDPAPADAPATSFSAERAVAVLERIVGKDQAPHGVGTPANAAVADRIEAELEALGLTVRRHRAMSCRNIVCAPVTNLVADVPGSHPGGPVVLFASHYDSTHAGPGASDDLHGVALSIEVARALLAGDPPKHPVRLLIDEGEEVGLLGAKAFVDQDPRASEVAVVVNAEARGTTGLSSLFQTSDGNGALVGAVLPEIPRPFATSLAIEIYRRMPNDTDLSVFLDAGYAGVNFAFVGGVGRYHTPLDDLAHLDHGSVQHQGDGVLGAVRALASGPLPVPRTDDAIYADLLGLFVVSWPASWAIAVPVGLTIILVGLSVVAWRRDRLRPARIVLGLVAVLGLLVLTVALSFGLAALVAWIQGEPVAAHAHPGPLRLALWLLAARVAWALASGLSRWARPLELAFGIAITWAVGAVALATAVPGASVALVVPVAVMTAGLGLAIGWARHEGAALALSTIGFVTLWTALFLGLEDVFGFTLAPAVAAPIAVALSPVIPGVTPMDGEGPWPRRLLSIGLLIVVVVACAIPVYDTDAPRRTTLVHHVDRTGDDATVMAITMDGLAPGLAEALGSTDEGPTPAWLGRAAVSTDGVPTDDPAPTLEVLTDEPWSGGRRVRARFHSERGADRAVLLLPSELVDRVEVGGQPVASAADRRGRLFLFGLPASGVEIDLWALGAEPIDVTVVDCVAGLPESARAIVQARDVDAIPVQWGDSRCVSATASL